MKNDYTFWEKYLADIKREILKKLRSKKEVHIDFHMHSNYSADGKQSLNQIIESTKKVGFDIIAITDHDNIDVYDELYNLVKNGLTDPIIIPGIEFTMDSREYGNQCHMLQLFINPKDKKLQEDVSRSYKAMFNRSKIQFRRLKENIAIQTILKKNKIKISYNEYIEYLSNLNLVPEYDTLCFYLIDKFKEKKVTTFAILDLLEKTNELDCYPDRKQYKEKRYKKLREKYEQNEMNDYNSRFLLSMLAVREVDDDWWDEPSSGSLSVNSYGQPKPGELTNNYNIIFAHPTEKSLAVVRELIKKNKKIIGLELNIRNHYEDISNFYNLLSEMNLLKVIGSDSHDNTLQFYQDMNYYTISSSELEKVIEKY